MDSTSDKWVKLTDNGEWGSYSVTLKSGTNILYWRTTGILMGSQVVKPILVKNITIEGVAYTSECFPCKPGTFSNKSGSSFCEICPRNTYSEKGAKECTKCPEATHYSDEGSGRCLERLPCSSKDFFQIHTPCDWEGKTQIMYKWVEPKICQEDVSEAVKLPPSGEKKECPPCNPGFYNNGSSFCAPCPSGMFSNGNQGATVETTLGNVNIKPEMFVPSETKLPDVHFYYKSSGASATCENGRTSVVTMRCNPTKLGQGEISVPSSCPAGTCDGCGFYFLWESAEACPMCTEQDYHEIEGACKKGHQETLYVWNEPKFCIKGVSLPEKKIIICETVDFWLKVGAGVGAFTGVLLIALTCYFWKKNQKLEYKYSKLVMTANSKECELPAADSCAIMEGEDNEEEIVYSNKQSLLGKLKSLATKEKEDRFESVQLKSSRSQNI
ncbi:UPF0577 protein KIAA1324-like homolog [Pseudonaja textilis]|uniref:UPF0577 protein KIAA1324-like homolog n=1 Tax=Pseudonaja textilis TaxID=8673 RepID=UPI000EAA6775|nr:UPF0577 protein KIAA1324-like homolog [Pseudonaja textilis]